MKAVLDHLVVNADDAERALAFYVDVLGLTPERVEQWRAGEIVFPSVRLNADTIIDILPPELWTRPAAGRGANVDHFCLCVDSADWEPLMTRVEKSGAEIEMGPTSLYGAHGQGMATYIKDSEGNRVELRHYP